MNITQHQYDNAIRQARAEAWEEGLLLGWEEGRKWGSGEETAETLRERVFGSGQ